MGLLMDIILIAILVLNVIIGYKKGLINVIFNIPHKKQKIKRNLTKMKKYI